jgi:probable F420-dependent oxidoreductase
MVMLKRVGVWNVGLTNEDPAAREEIQSAAVELEELGYGAAWLGASPHPDRALPLLEATSELVVATGIFRIWDQDAASIAARHAAITAAHPGRFLLGLGASHSALIKEYAKPYSAMVAYLDGLDAAPTPVPKEERVLAALGPRMLELARDRALGAHPYLVTPEYAAKARATLGDGPLLAPEIKVVWGLDRPAAMERARKHLAVYLQMPNYTSNLLRNGFTEDDLANGGSDRLVEATFVLGGHDALRDRVGAFFDAGADHAVIQVVTGERLDLPREEWREIATVLDLPPAKPTRTP